MNTKYTWLVLSIFCFASSCKKDDLNEVNKKSAKPPIDWLASMFIDTSSYDAYFFIGHSCMRDAHNVLTAEHFGISGTAFADLSAFDCNNRVYAGLLTVHDQVIYGDSTSSCVGYLDPTTNQAEPMSLSSQFGGEVGFKLNGSGAFPAIDDSVCLPEKIYISANANHENTPGMGMFPSVSKGGGFTLQWNADLGNKYGKVGVMLSVSHLFTGINDSLLNISVGDAVHSFITDDDGSYTFDSLDFEQFPENSVIHIFVSRVCTNEIQVNNRRVSVVGKTDSWITVAIKP